MTIVVTFPDARRTRSKLDPAAGRYHIRVPASTVVRETSRRLARWRKIASAVLLSAYFLCFAWDGLHARWAEDDMMNLYGAWKPGPWQLLLSQFRPWHGDYRPMGGAFYAVLFTMFGLNPLPYRAVSYTHLTLPTKRIV